jgi:hypothetical protein
VRTSGFEPAHFEGERQESCEASPDESFEYDEPDYPEQTLAQMTQQSEHTIKKTPGRVGLNSYTQFDKLPPSLGIE